MSELYYLSAHATRNFNSFSSIVELKNDRLQIPNNFIFVNFIRTGSVYTSDFYYS